MTEELRSRAAAAALLAAAVLLVVAACLPAMAAMAATAQPRGGGAAGGGGRQGKEGGSALAVLQAAPGATKVDGTVLFYSRGGTVQVVADVSGLDKPGLYALRIHEKGECVADPAGKAHFASAGADFNPAGVAHGCPEAPKHHAGDLGNVEVKADGTGHLELSSGALSLAGANSLIGKAVILHAGSDDCATQPDGNAGARLACGVAESVDDSSSRQPRRRGRTPPGFGSGGSPPGAR